MPCSRVCKFGLREEIGLEDELGEDYSGELPIHLFGTSLHVALRPIEMETRAAETGKCCSCCVSSRCGRDFLTPIF